MESITHIKNKEALRNAAEGSTNLRPGNANELGNNARVKVE